MSTIPNTPQIKRYAGSIQTNPVEGHYKLTPVWAATGNQEILYKNSLKDSAMSNHDNREPWVADSEVTQDTARIDIKRRPADLPA